MKTETERLKAEKIAAYKAFLESKVAIAGSCGFECGLDDVNPILKPHQKAVVQWAVRGGRRALFLAFGLGKSVIQLEIVRIVLRKLERGRGLIVCPLGVRQEFRRDAEMLGIRTAFIRTTDEAAQIPVDGIPPQIFITNYESVREGKVDPRSFDALSLDEAGVLRGMGGTKTFREFMGFFEGTATYRFVATATPSPNEYIELLAYAAFLDILDVGQAKTRFFKRDATKADSLTLHPHKERDFWLWCASWAVFLQRPSDLGFDDTGYELPAIDVRWHEVPTDHAAAGDNGHGQRLLLVDTAIGVQNAAREKRASLDARIERMVQIVQGFGKEGSLFPEVLRGKQGEIQGEIRPAQQGPGIFQGLLPEEQGEVSGVWSPALSETQGKDCREDEGVARRQSGEDAAIRKGQQGKKPGFSYSEESRLLPGEQGEGQHAKQGPKAGEVRDDQGVISGKTGDAGMGLPDLQGGASPLRKDREGCGDRSLPCDGQGSRNPLPPMQCGSGPIQGQSRDTYRGGGLYPQFIVWCDLNAEQEAIDKALDNIGISYSSLYGSDGIDHRELSLQEWRDQKTSAFVSKPSMYGAGVNLQQCSKAIFLGVTFKFSEFVQAVKRIHRFLQTERCEIHIIYSEAERAVKDNLLRKWSQHEELVEKMSAIIREFGLAHESMRSALRRSMGVERVEASGKSWKVINNDTILESFDLPDDSAGLILTSIPFGNQYEYSPSYNDLGHNEDAEHFWAQMDFLTPELFRICQPGRICAIHVKDRITPKGINGMGFQTVAPLHAEAIAHYTRHGFGYLGMKTITTDVVRENNQTYRLGWTEQCKDGSRMGCGMPEYLLLFRKPPTDRTDGYADVKVVKDKDKYSLGRWQVDAHGYMRSSGNRLLSPDDMRGLPHEAIYKLWKADNASNVYDYERHVALCDKLKEWRILPVTFALLPPHSVHPDVWSDITRMRTLNGSQYAQGKEAHLCCLQFDIVERAINQYSNPGDLVFDPFVGIGTVAMMAVKMGRRGLGVELNPAYHADAVAYCQTAEAQAAVPTLFDLAEEAS